MVAFKTYNLAYGTTFIIDPELINVRLLRVTRSGTGYNSSGGDTPGSREFKYTSSTGRVEFLNPGASGAYNPGSTYDELPETVTVRYKY